MNADGIWLCHDTHNPKRSFPTRKTALLAIRSGASLRAYECDCGSWHLTKLTKEQYSKQQDKKEETTLQAAREHLRPLLLVGYQLQPSGVVVSPEGVHMGKVKTRDGQLDTPINVQRALDHWTGWLQEPVRV